MKNEERTWKIWYWRYNAKTDKVEHGFRTKEYKRFGNARNAARKLFENTDFNWVINDTNPFIKHCKVCGKPVEVITPFHRPSYLKSVLINERNGHIKTNIYFDHLCVDCAGKIQSAINECISDIKKEASNEL